MLKFRKKRIFVLIIKDSIWDMLRLFHVQLFNFFFFFFFFFFFQLERDIMIWNNKQYKQKPVFIKSSEDILMVKHRRWFSQFYSENSPKMTFQKENLDW